jgi:hypothetical protein
MTEYCGCGDLCERQPKEEIYDTILTAADIREMARTGGRLEGHWAITVDVPNGIDPFSSKKLWLDLINTLTESCGVKITTVRFNLSANVAGYEFLMREE